MTVAEAHDVMDAVEAKLQGEFPGVEILIHVDPEGQVDEPGNPLVETDLTPGARESTNSASCRSMLLTTAPSPGIRPPSCRSTPGFGPRLCTPLGRASGRARRGPQQ